MIKELLVTTLVEIIGFAGLIILFGLILEFFETRTNQNYIRVFGKNSLLVTGIVGVPIHELSHAVMAILFAHRITDIKLFQRPDKSGVMGYVNHTYHSKNIYHLIGNFFIGIAPILGGSIFIMILIHFLIPDALANYFIEISKSQILLSWESLTVSELFIIQLELLKNIFLFGHFKQLSFYLFLYLSISTASHMSLSLADLKGALQGLMTITIIFIVLNLLGMNEMILNQIVFQYNLFLLSILTIAVLFSFFSYFLSLIFRGILR